MKMRGMFQCHINYDLLKHFIEVSTLSGEYLVAVANNYY